MDTTAETRGHTTVKTGLPAHIIVCLIDAYRFLLSPLLGRQCRFHPSCSCYARDAVLTHGALRGSWLAIARLGRCHPWAPGGIDEVPQALTSHSQEQSPAAERNH